MTLNAVHPVRPARSAERLTDVRMAVGWRPAKVDPVRFINRPSDRSVSDKNEIHTLLRCLTVAAFATLNVVMLSVAAWASNTTNVAPEQRDFLHWLSALIALPGAAYAGRPFVASAIRGVAAGRANRDALLSVGVMLALGISLFETLRHAAEAYFDAALLLLTFLLVGRALEQAMLRLARAFAANLAALRAQTVMKFVSATALAEVPVEIGRAHV